MGLYGRISLKASRRVKPSTSLSSSLEPDLVFAIIQSRSPSYLKPQKSRGLSQVPFFLTQNDFSALCHIPSSSTVSLGSQSSLFEAITPSSEY